MVTLLTPQNLGRQHLRTQLHKLEPQKHDLYASGSKASATVRNLFLRLRPPLLNLQKHSFDFLVEREKVILKDLFVCPTFASLVKTQPSSPVEDRLRFYLVQSTTRDNPLLIKMRPTMAWFILEL